jgi:hypothetical protein
MMGKDAKTFDSEAEAVAYCKEEIDKEFTRGRATPPEVAV